MRLPRAAPPSVAGEIFIAFSGGQTNGNAITFTPDANWNTPPPGAVQQSGTGNGDAWVAGGYFINAGTGTKAWAPSINGGAGGRKADSILIGLK